MSAQNLLWILGWYFILEIWFLEKKLLFDSFIRNGLKIYFCGLISRIQNEKIIILKVVILDCMDIIYGFRMCFYWEFKSSGSKGKEMLISE